jgi:hypothetical protein
LGLGHEGEARGGAPQGVLTHQAQHTGPADTRSRRIRSRAQTLR